MNRRILALGVLLLGLIVALPQGADAITIDPMTGKPLQHPGVWSFTPIPRETISFQENYQPGTIVVKTAEKRLYYVLEDGRAIRYGIGVGREGYTFSGTFNLSRKAEWPTWTPTAEMHARTPNLPKFMPGGPGNPMGARALYVGSTLYRIHGTNENYSIGREMSSGCIRMTNEDVIDLYNRAKVGAKIVVIQ